MQRFIVLLYYLHQSFFNNFGDFYRKKWYASYRLLTFLGKIIQILQSTLKFASEQLNLDQNTLMAVYHLLSIVFAPYFYIFLKCSRFLEVVTILVMLRSPSAALPVHI